MYSIYFLAPQWISVTDNFFSGCSPGWTYFPNNAHCYKHFSATKTWINARSYCRSLAQTNGDLVSIPDQATNQFLTTLSTDNSWTGASDAASEGSWTWSDGTPWGYESWLQGEPNNSGDQDYGTINHYGAGLWDDLQGTYHKPFFCQYDLGEKLQKSLSQKSLWIS